MAGRITKTNSFSESVDKATDNERENKFAYSLSKTERDRYFQLSDEDREEFREYKNLYSEATISEFCRQKIKLQAIEEFKANKYKLKGEPTDNNIMRSCKSIKGKAYSIYIPDELIGKLNEACRIMSGDKRYRSTIIQTLLERYLESTVKEYVKSLESQLHKEE